MKIQTQIPTSASSNDVVKNDKTNQSAAAEQNRPATAAEMSRANKQELNQSILQSQLDISLKSENKSLGLLYRTVLSAVGKSLKNDGEKPPLPEQAADRATEARNKDKPGVGNNPYSQTEDTSPQATADRIVAFATNFYQQYREQNKDLTDEDAMTKFMDIIGGGIDKGFTEARDVLDGMGELQGKVKEDIDSTYELIQKGLQSFRELTLEKAKENSTTNPAEPIEDNTTN
ncbi:DUF5610 domain-containing protein [Rheinheimera sp.]|uniref:DUF5610 domain-containing protein n=1 Tax=Rheinheimera sp. TaxID=1869214 RepID=UPI0027B8EF25|nr:DUF5610 domain-containing protein [Rheinheimera sp.]